MDQVKLKSCSKCKNNKDVICFSKNKSRKDGLSEQCKDCKKLYNCKNKINIDSYNKRFNIENKYKISERKKIYYLNNKESILNYKKETKEVRNLHDKNRKLKDPAYKLRRSISTVVFIALKKKKSSKYGKSIIENLSYTIQELKKHIENQFELWMNWSNWGKYNSKTWDDNDSSTWTWQIDHIIPQSKLAYISMEDDNFKKCWSLDNLRPLSAKQNLLDGASRYLKN